MCCHANTNVSATHMYETYNHMYMCNVHVSAVYLTFFETKSKRIFVLNLGILQSKAVFFFTFYCWNIERHFCVCIFFCRLNTATNEKNQQTIISLIHRYFFAITFCPWWLSAFQWSSRINKPKPSHWNRNKNRFCCKKWSKYASILNALQKALTCSG